MKSLHNTLWCLGFAGVGVWLASNPRAVLRLTSAYYVRLNIEAKSSDEEIARLVWLPRASRLLGACRVLSACFVFLIGSS
jgi:hypothetical protein